MSEPAERVRARREPPALRRVTVVEREVRSPRLVRLTFEGAGLQELVVELPAASVRLLVPTPGDGELVIPEWNGNEFLRPDGSRPALRTFTPLRVDNDAGRLDLEIVRHPGGAVSGWAEDAEPGAEAAISGPGKGYEIDAEADRFVLFGDETAVPAISDLLEALPPDVTVGVHVEVTTDEAVVALPDHPGATHTWYLQKPGAPPGDELVTVARRIEDLDAATRLWAAGEAASMQAIRTHLFQTLGVPRDRTSIRGYWKPRR